jgi:hypothetical protein
VIARAMGTLVYAPLCHFDQAARSPRRLAKVYADDIATIHVRKQNALHTFEPAVDAKAK